MDGGRRDSYPRGYEYGGGGVSEGLLHEGPWAVKATPYGTYYVADAKGNAVCNSGWRDDLDAISAVPELLKACEAIIHAYENADDVDAALGLAQTAIKKVRRRSA